VYYFFSTSGSRLPKNCQVTPNDGKSGDVVGLSHFSSHLHSEIQTNCNH
jgi:hypothetical protein